MLLATLFIGGCSGSESAVDADGATESPDGAGDDVNAQGEVSGSDEGSIDAPAEVDEGDLSTDSQNTADGEAIAGDDVGDGETDDEAAIGDPSAEVATSTGPSLMGGGQYGLADPAILSATGEGLEGDELEAYIADRYEAFWAVYDDARSAPGTDPITAHPALGELAAGEQLETAMSVIDTMRAEGQALREPESPAISGIDSDAEHRVKVELVDEGLAEITACTVNDDLRIDTASGSVVDGSPVTVKSTSTMVRADRAWKLIRSQATEITQGVGGCWDEGEAAYPY